MPGVPEKESSGEIDWHFILPWAAKRAFLKVVKSRDVKYRPLLLLFSHSVVSDSVTPWTVARQAPLSMGLSR